MTDERIMDLDGAIAALPKGAGIIFRHYATSPRERRELFNRVLRLARQRRLKVLLADTPLRAWQWGADGAHHRSALRSRGLRSVPVHNGRERAAANDAQADLIVISPIFVTRSHPAAQTLGVVKAGLIAADDRRKAIALGGVDQSNWKRIAALGLHGWAAIDGLSKQPVRSG